MENTNSAIQFFQWVSLHTHTPFYLLLIKLWVLQGKCHANQNFWVQISCSHKGKNSILWLLKKEILSETCSQNSFIRPVSWKPDITVNIFTKQWISNWLSNCSQPLPLVFTEMTFLNHWLSELMGMSSSLSLTWCFIQHFICRF